MIGTWMETLRDVELQRIADAPQMLFGQYTLRHERCLGLTAYGIQGTSAQLYQAGMPGKAVCRYDDICRKAVFGYWRNIKRGEWDRLCKTGYAPQPVLTMLRNRARKILASRSLKAFPEQRRSSVVLGAAK